MIEARGRGLERTMSIATFSPETLSEPVIVTYWYAVVPVSRGIPCVYGQSASSSFLGRLCRMRQQLRRGRCLHRGRSCVCILGGRARRHDKLSAEAATGALVGGHAARPRLILTLRRLGDLVGDGITR